MLAEVRSTAKELLDATDKVALNQSPHAEGFDLVSTIESFRVYADQSLHDHLTDPFRKIGRNQRVVVRDKATNRISTAKFKFVEQELRSGVYQLEKSPSVDN
jgi:hypothetical protein